MIKNWISEVVIILNIESLFIIEHVYKFPIKLFVLLVFLDVLIEKVDDLGGFLAEFLFVHGF